MKLLIILMTSTFIQVSASGYSQTVTYSGTNVTLKRAFDVIHQQTGYGILIPGELLAETNKVSLRLKNATIEDAIKACLIQQRVALEFYWLGKGIVIRRKAVSNERSSDNSLDSSNQTIVAKGIVYNEAGQPLSGANVIDKLSGRGTITNARGEFKLSGVQLNSILLISYIGFASQPIKITNDNAVQVYLNLAKNELDKAVVQGYGTTTQRLNTGNIVTVTGEQISRQPVMNALSVLEGNVPGLVIQQTNGYASAPFKAEIRGRSVIDGSQPSEPLYVIDGVPITILNLGGANYSSGSFGFLQGGLSGPAGGQSPFFSINPEDVESITVLKDGDATAIYGSRGANGVIIITTKSGKSGKTKVELNAYQGLSSVTGRYKLLTTSEYLSMRREAFKNDGLTPNVRNAYDILSWDTTRYTDWQKFLWGKNGITTDAEIGLSGGDKQNTFRVSGSFHHETSILSRSGSDKRGTLQFNYNHKSLNQRLILNYSNQFSLTESNLIYIGGSVTTAPNAPAIFNSQGKLNWAGWDPVPNNLTTYGALLQPYNSKTNFLNSQLKVQYSLIKGLRLSTLIGYSNFHNTNNVRVPIVSLNPNNNPTGSAIFTNTNGVNVIVEPQAEYSTAISRGKFNVIVGGTYQSASNEGNNVTGTGFINDNLLRSVSNAPVKAGGNSSGQYRYDAVFARLNYNWEDKYIINISGRRDGSSRFGPGRQFGNFGSIGAAWIFTEQKWLKDRVSVLSFGKLRASYGVTGFDGFNDYIYLTQWSSLNVFPYQGVSPYIPLLHSNPDLQWESTRKLEAALELGFVKDRFRLEVAWYRNRCGNQLTNIPLPYLTGFPTVFGNSPATIQNMGFEGTLKAKIIDSKNLNVNLGFNITMNRNKLIAFPNIENTAYASVMSIGKSLSTYRVLHYAGVDPQTGQYAFTDINKNGAIEYTYNGGKNDLVYRDIGIRFYGGFTADIQFRGVSLNLFFIYRQQPFLQSAIYNNVPGAAGINQSRDVLNRWKVVGDHSQFARYTTQPKLTDQLFYQSDGVYSNGSFIRLRNVSLSYDCPTKWLSRMGLSVCRIYVRGQNLLLLTKYNGLDPEAANLGQLPLAKVIVAGLQLNL